MADFSDGWAVINLLAENDWYGISVRELAERLEWEYQKTHRVLRDVAESNCAHCAPNGTWRLSENFLSLLIAAQASYIDRLNFLVPPPSPAANKTGG